mmetsp:Transcript_34947/g.112637  ORF Transcript_34947/g.112637 Transcript_34947/m.112637 type:complete len:213 (-) Transcript_34947:1987-2625(-)|eukprot:scaffold931_cov117-Isochrysis_galbana.AAC.8
MTRSRFSAPAPAVLEELVSMMGTRSNGVSGSPFSMSMAAPVSFSDSPLERGVRRAGERKEEPERLIRVGGCGVQRGDAWAACGGKGGGGVLGGGGGAWRASPRSDRVAGRRAGIGVDVPAPALESPAGCTCSEPTCGRARGGVIPSEAERRPEDLPDKRPDRVLAGKRSQCGGGRLDLLAASPSRPDASPGSALGAGAGASASRSPTPSKAL